MKQRIYRIRLNVQDLVRLGMPRIGVIGIIAFGALVYFLGSGNNDWDPNRMSATEYIGAIAFLALFFYFITNSRDDLEKADTSERITIQKPHKQTRKKKKKKKKSSR